MTDVIERLRAATREAIAEIERLRNNKPTGTADLAFLETPLSEISFGRLINARVHHLRLRDNSAVRCSTVRDLVALTEAEILREANVGRATVEAIKAVLADHGLHLGMDT
jgi:DNA-directed RNA polymerase alpha subunit